MEKQRGNSTIQKREVKKQDLIKLLENYINRYKDAKEK
jgi:hypothetical protein|tara:strand:- start:2911 stop:3024 length:114 start_codon:yes stop_codon:yes gene_type:complete